MDRIIIPVEVKAGKMGRLCSLKDALVATLTEEEQQDLLANLLIGSSWRTAESNLAFLLGSAVDKRLAMH